MRIIEVIISLLLYGYGAFFFAAFQLDLIRGEGIMKNTNKHLAFAMYLMVVVDVIAATLLLRS